MNDWEKFLKTSLPDKQSFYSDVNMEINSYAEYALAKRVYKDVEIKNVGENYDVYVQGDTLWLADVFEDF